MLSDNRSNDGAMTLAMLPVRDIVVFPYMILPLFVGRESSIRAVEEALAKNRLIFLASQKEITEENPTPDSIYSVGTVAKIMRMRKLSDGRVKILIQGECKGRITSYSRQSPNFEVVVERIDEPHRAAVQPKDAPIASPRCRSQRHSGHPLGNRGQHRFSDREGGFRLCGELLRPHCGRD